MSIALESVVKGSITYDEYHTLSDIQEIFPSVKGQEIGLDCPLFKGEQVTFYPNTQKRFVMRFNPTEGLYSYIAVFEQEEASLCEDHTLKQWYRVVEFWF